MGQKTRYWVVSPNVTGEDGEKYVEEWEKIIRKEEVAIMGWGPNEKKKHTHGRKMGRMFAGISNPSIQPGDVILIARGRVRQELVAAGIVDNKRVKRDSRKKVMHMHPDGPVQKRHLEGFEWLEEVAEHAKNELGRALETALPQQDAMRQLEDLPGDKEVKKWLSQLLRVGDQYDEENEEYQHRTRLANPADHEEGPRKPEFSKTHKGPHVKKNPRLAALRFLMSDYKCEVDPAHQPFTSRITNKNFVEAHHLVPARMDVQEKFKCALDHENNIVSLCPNCHRRLHHAVSDEKNDILRRLYRRRRKELDVAGIHLSMARLISYYE